MLLTDSLQPSIVGTSVPVPARATNLHMAQGFGGGIVGLNEGSEFFELLEYTDGYTKINVRGIETLQFQSFGAQDDLFLVWEIGDLS